ncbi:1-(5-phosphoribosyl)-5-[(5-phosphoribosylamino)methylideneamino] imidazole-4-carboxamide isomerase [Sporobacter termitidis DSM 10068]|uniref:1-(5-phosphoribosyl)-5-[(5-phosphoribosylamino)methylideneamino] imidazole-4-carboxamide isomerase n=1 Tax=Sporobacter termitidis DSM 10068 TaxID=1123282 RepID=A0A1M5VQS9_9FIRM|nr:1-(5-phosphoribosyl)-5-[(5-phosphoribosylamino)methylideneamino]imidazole-4-carboxamide isomerase [Sporobacter termitidis]SHH77587.1 1-(5-phosphoribosyl)-5-[(5-phosphoribosylamino)methylideneamino] imidazole-4-carboxamide isomerase [Sporobacter termitidis DSM 10068]
MILFPAIDLYHKSAVRLVKGDYAQMTVYSASPAAVAASFRDAGATHIHVVDLEGARDGTTANIGTVGEIVRQSGLFVEAGGGIRSRDVIEKYLDIGVGRVILGTAAVAQPGFVGEMVSRFGGKIAVGVDVKDGFVAVKGWTEVTGLECFDFCRQMEQQGVKTIICTDISKDGVLGGTNLELYRKLSDALALDIVASGGVTSLDDVRALGAIGLYGAILGKAIYEGRIDLKEAVRLSQEMRCGE